ncbi:MAG: C39 family peptidase [bacterium]|nr:C39 family peptidase [bacterium]
MVAKPGSQSGFKRKLQISVGAIFLILVFFFSIREDSTYHKISRLEHLAKTIFYSVDNGLALVLPQKDESFSLSMPYYKQENGLTCEVAALRTALAYLGSYVSETELIGKLVFDTRVPMSPEGIWGDPENGFVGDINGSIFYRTGFGVYEKPILALALNYKTAAIIEKADLIKVLEEVLSGNPVLAWGLLSRRAAVSWKTLDGKVIEVRPGEHVRVVIGFTGEIDNPTKIILLDPIYGLIKMNKDKFVSDWKIMNNRAVVVYK